MANKESKKINEFDKLMIPICIALPFNLILLKDEESENCRAVTQDSECPYAKRRRHDPSEFKCDKNTLTPNHLALI